MDGWIKLHRQIVKSSKFADPDILRLWILCLTKASHKGGTAIIDKQEIHLNPGQFVTGRFALHEDYNQLLSPRKKVKDTTLWSWLKRLEQWGDLDIKATNKYSVVTVLKWCDYQETLTTEPQQTDNKLTAEPQQTDTNKNVKNDKNDKNVKKEDKTSSRKRPVYEDDSIPYRSASYLLKKIREHSPGYKEPNLQQWANDMRLMIESDKREPITIATVIDWATSNSFWQSNILSASKLREKFDTLQSQMKRGGNNGHVVSDSGGIHQHSEPEPDWNKFVFRGRA